MHIENERGNMCWARSGFGNKWPEAGAAAGSFVMRPDRLLRMSDNTRLVVMLVVSVLVHAVILFAWSSNGASGTAYGLRQQGGPLTVRLEARQLRGADAEAVAAGTVHEQVRSADTLHAQQAAPSIVRYFAPDELDKPVVLANGMQAETLTNHPEEGDVIFRLWIESSGTVVRVEPVTEELSQAFIADTRARFMNSVFLPGVRHGRSVASVTDVALRYARTVNPT